MIIHIYNLLLRHNYTLFFFSNRQVHSEQCPLNPTEEDNNYYNDIEMFEYCYCIYNNYE